MQDTTIKSFLKLSSWLTGYDILPQSIGADYLVRLEHSSGYKDYLHGLLEKAEDSKDYESFIDSLSIEQKNYCKGIAFLWYTSELIAVEFLSDKRLTETRQAGTQEQYYSGLIWKVIHAHPPGLSGGYYGYWKYEPEN